MNVFVAQEDWAARAACLGEDPELFFPISEVGPGARQIEQAKAVCARCPVRYECLEYALEAGLDEGVFGGASAEERRAMAPGVRQNLFA